MKKIIFILLSAMFLTSVPANAQLDLVEGLVRKGVSMIKSSSKKSKKTVNKNTKNTTTQATTSTEETPRADSTEEAPKTDNTVNEPQATSLQSYINEAALDNDLRVIRVNTNGKTYKMIKIQNKIDNSTVVHITGKLPVSGTMNGHEYVDMGFDVKWAACNIGANCQEGRGGFFMWGENSEKRLYEASYSSVMDKPIYQSHIKGIAEHDAATKNWGGKWRVPTLADFSWMRLKCTEERATLNGIYGWLYTSKKNGNMIFLPAWGEVTGFIAKYKFENDADTEFIYWTCTEFNLESTDLASYFTVNSPSFYTQRTKGMQVRPVFGEQNR